MRVEAALAALREAADPTRKPGMARVGIAVTNALGVSMPHIRAIAERAGRDHGLAIELWASGIHEARMLATLVEDAAAVTEPQAEAWVTGLDSWDVGDSAADLFASTSLRDAKIRAWARRDEPFVKRCAFAMIARRAVSDKAAPDRTFTAYFPTIRRGASDDRNEVKKAVSWALRQIGKRNLDLHDAAVLEAETMLDRALAMGSRGARWVARDVLRELRDPVQIARLS